MWALPGGDSGDQEQPRTGAARGETSLAVLQDLGQAVEGVVESGGRHLGLSRLLRGLGFPSPVSGAGRNVSIQVCWMVSTWAGGVWAAACVQGSRAPGPPL